MSAETGFANAVAIKLIRYRVEYGLSQTQVARKLGMHQPAIARLEAGIHEPTLYTLSRLAKGLGIEFRIVVASNGKVVLLQDESNDPVSWRWLVEELEQKYGPVPEELLVKARAMWPDAQV
jgi:transcriptional regulator with XRE-family HTH domain